MKKAIAWYKTCVLRTTAYIHIYNSIGITVMLFAKYDIPMKYIPIGVVCILLAILIVGSLDILLGIYQEENRIGHERSPILMEILNHVKEGK